MTVQIEPQHFSRVVYSGKLAGFTYYDGAELFHKLKIGTKLKLKAEPNNEMDANAVAVYLKHNKVGFLSGDKNKFISCALRCGHNIFTCHVQALDASAHPEAQVRIVVKVKMY